MSIMKESLMIPFDLFIFIILFLILHTMDIAITAITITNCYIKIPYGECYLMEQNPFVRYIFENAHDISIKFLFTLSDALYCALVIGFFIHNWNKSKITRYVALIVLFVLIYIVINNISAIPHFP